MIAINNATNLDIPKSDIDWVTNYGTSYDMNADNTIEAWRYYNYCRVICLNKNRTKSQNMNGNIFKLKSFDPLLSHLDFSCNKHVSVYYK